MRIGRLHSNAGLFRDATLHRAAGAGHPGLARLPRPAVPAAAVRKGTLRPSSDRLDAPSPGHPLRRPAPARRRGRLRPHGMAATQRAARAGRGDGRRRRDRPRRKAGRTGRTNPRSQWSSMPIHARPVTSSSPWDQAPRVSGASVGIASERSIRPEIWMRTARHRCLNKSAPTGRTVPSPGNAMGLSGPISVAQYSRGRQDAQVRTVATQSGSRPHATTTSAKAERADAR